MWSLQSLEHTRSSGWFQRLPQPCFYLENSARWPNNSKASPPLQGTPSLQNWRYTTHYSTCISYIQPAKYNYSSKLCHQVPNETAWIQRYIENSRFNTPLTFFSTIHKIVKYVNMLIFLFKILSNSYNCYRMIPLQHFH